MSRESGISCAWKRIGPPRARLLGEARLERHQPLELLPIAQLICAGDPRHLEDVLRVFVVVLTELVVGLADDRHLGFKSAGARS